MTRLRFFLAAAFALLSMCALPAAIGAQGTINLDLPSTDPFPAAPDIHVSAVGLPPANAPYSLRLRLALEPSFGLVVYDSTMAGTDVDFRTIRLLPENQGLFAEASVVDAGGRTVLTTLRFAGKTGPRLTLLAPNGSINITLTTRHPRFSWRSAVVTGPPGPWIYELRVMDVATQQMIVHQGITDTVYVLPDTLQAQTSYRWSVIARLVNGLASDATTVNSASSFVVFPSDQAPISLLYQNFPNPFPAPSSATTCIWFDLEKSGHVRLSVLDIRGRKVKTIIPGLIGDAFGAGRYGRLRDGDSSGCDPKFTWDGTADDGRTVPPGVYLLHLVVDGGTPMVRKMLFLAH